VIAVQNKITRQMFLDAGMADPDKVVVRGCPRMDGLLDRMTRKAGVHTSHFKQIAYFTSPRHTELLDATIFDFFSTSKQVVKVLVQMAKDDPDLHIVLKIKDMHMRGPTGDQIGEFISIIKDVAGAEDVLPNIKIETGRLAAQDIIRESDIICVMQSTIVLEAGITGKPVIVPHFETLREQHGAETILQYQEYRELFDVPRDSDDLKRMIARRLADPHVDEETIAKRRELFVEHVSPLEERATDRVLSLIRTLAEKGRDARRRLSDVSTCETDRVY
jgi:hypothetical protein